MSFTNLSTKQVLNTTIANLSTTDTNVSNLQATKQDNVVATTDLTMKDLQASSLSYDESGVYKNVKTEIDALNSKLSSTTSILTSSLESPDQAYNLDTLLERILTNKIKLETFVNELNGAVGDNNTGVVSLMEQVAQNKANIAAEIVNRGSAVDTLTATVTANASLEASNNTARVADIALINSTNTHQYIISGEGGVPVFGDLVPYESPNFGLPILKQGYMQSIHYLAKTPDNSLSSSHTMTLTFEIWDSAGVHVSSRDVTFTNKFQKHVFNTGILLPESSNMVIKYKSSAGTWHTDSRFRLAIGVL